jgi:uncharacterized membrane protein YozB (DUF420 family)
MGPWQAVTAVVWAVVAPPVLIYAATLVRRGKVRLHMTLMAMSVIVEVAVVLAFSFLLEPNPRRAQLESLPIFRIHLAFAITALVGIGWQLASRTVPVLRPLHRHSGPYVVFVWCLALVTGIYNYVFLYVMG